MNVHPTSISRAFSLLAMLSLIVAGNHCAAQTKPEKIDALMKLCVEYGQFNGSVLVAEHGKVIFKKGYGFANMEWNIPNAPDTKFRLGSVTKQFTSMLILQLVQQGKLKLDGHITDYLPGYPKKNGDRITIHHLLTHTSGIPNYTSFASFGPVISRNPSTPQEFIKLFADSALDFDPGSKFSYSNSGYFVLGAIIEQVTGKPYEQVLHENILTPLGMTSTGYDHSETVLKKRAAGYGRNGPEYVNAAYIDMSLPYSAGSLYSTVEDLYLWDQALYTDKLLTEKTKALLFKPSIPALGESYAYGWFVGNVAIGRSADSVMEIEHGGSINGFNSLISRIPSEKNLVVLLNNTGGTNLAQMSRAIRGILYDKPYDLPKRSVADTLYATIRQRGLAAGLALYRELMDHHADTFDVIETDMNIDGYRLLQAGKVKEAIEVFKLNVEAFPKSSNVYDSLGEAYLANGDKELAITNYRKSVELDPRNANGIETLRKLQSK